MSILISGSLAYDYIMDFPDSFKNHILPDQLHILNVSFMVSKLEKGLGGNAGNIAYTIKLLGGKPVIASTLGKDGAEYLAHWKKIGISAEHVINDDKRFTSSAYITTDKDDNQITAFYPGPAERSAEIHLKDTAQDISIVLISPTHQHVMLQHLQESRGDGFITVFDPGQQITAFNSQELKTCIDQADFIVGNDYEIKLICERTGWSVKELVGDKRILITTLGERGSVVATAGEVIEIAPCQPQSVDDPTGAGDAFRAGFFVAYEKKLSLATCAKVGSCAASYAIENYGTQSHTFTIKEFQERYKKTYGEEIDLN